uniref:Bm10324 n=1 Tax=Brugia malayi TaxID=6279 RepID=A0A1I9G6Q5_BRUMA|nr:Bm10324 [Brugia malayi]
MIGNNSFFLRSMECFVELLDALEEEKMAIVGLKDQQSSSRSHGNKTCCKQARYLRIVEGRRLNRYKERRRRRENQTKNPILKELSFILQIYIDFGFTYRMSDKEISKLVRQMGRVWGLQKKSPGLQVTLLSPDERFLYEGRQKMSGFDRFKWIISDKSIDEFITKCPMVYLSPDSQLDALLDVRPDEIYIIGGLVDETGVGSLSYDRAEELGLDARRLPIQEFLHRSDSGTFNVMLTINQVVEILVRYVYSKNWTDALSVVPKRIGYEMVHNMDQKDDFFGIREATETSLPRHMEAAIMLRSRTMGKNRREASNKQNVVSDQRDSRNSNMAIDTSGTDYIDSLYFGAFENTEIGKEENSKADNATSDASGIDYVDMLLAEQHPDGSSNDFVEDSNEDGDNDGDRIVQSVEALDLKTYNDMGIKKIWEEIEPVWKMNNDDLVNIMTNRIIYEDEELIAFNKPYQVACSNAPSNQAELLRILPQLSSRITPHMNCLRIVKSIGKSVTGVTLFAKNQNVQEKIKTLYENGLIEQCYRVITNMAPAHQEATINIPLMLPLSANSSNEITPFLEASTYYRVLRHDPKNHTSYMECVVNCDVPEQIRAHLGIGIACPIIGDIKYNYSRREAGRGIPPRLSDSALRDLNIAGNSFRRLPMYIHLKEVIIPLSKQSSNKIHICAPIPSFFTYTLRKLRLLKK